MQKVASVQQGDDDMERRDIRVTLEVNVTSGSQGSDNKKVCIAINWDAVPDQEKKSYSTFSNGALAELMRKALLDILEREIMPERVIITTED